MVIKYLYPFNVKIFENRLKEVGTSVLTNINPEAKHVETSLSECRTNPT